jgi:hypothetical protein
MLFSPNFSVDEVVHAGRRLPLPAHDRTGRQSGSGESAPFDSAARRSPQLHREGEAPEQTLGRLRGPPDLREHAAQVVLTAEVAGEYLKKGRPVFVEGRLQLDSWDDKTSGQKRTKLKVIGENMQMLGSPRGGGSSGGGDEEGSSSAPRSSSRPAPPPKAAPSAPDDDEIPF